MKKIFFLIPVMIFFFVLVVKGGDTVYFRFNSPRIIYSFNNSADNGTGAYCENLEWDVEIKCNNSGTRYYAIQWNTTADTTNFKDVDFTPGTYGQLTPTNYYNYNFNHNDNHWNFAITTNQQIGNGTLSHYIQVPTTFGVVGTCRIRIVNPGVMANIAFLKSIMQGNELEKTFNPNGFTQYLDPANPYPGHNFLYLYTGRIYSSTWGWSQTGGVTQDVQYLYWPTAVNTSVWDTSSSAATITGAGSKAAKLRIHPGARLKIVSGGQLTASDSTIISEAKGLWIAAGTGSGGSGTADGSFIDNGKIAYNTGGTAEEEIYLTGNRWHYVSSPITGAQSGVFLNQYLRSYDETVGNWSAYIVPTNVALTVMQGYEVWVDATSKTDFYTGQFNTGSQSYTLTNHGLTANYGWNLLGNPFPSAQDFGNSGSPVAGWTWPVGPWRTLYYLQTGDGTSFSYATYAWAGGGVGVNGGTQYIPSGQGYMIWEDHGTPSAVVSADNQTRVHNSQAFWKGTPDDSRSNFLRLTANGNGFNDETVVYFADNASSGFEGDQDAFKLMNGGLVPSVYAVTSDNTDVAIDALPFEGSTTIVPLEFRSTKSGTFTFTASNLESFNSSIHIFIKNIKLNSIQELTNGTPVYSFDYQTGENPGRFELLFKNPNIPDPAFEGMHIYSFENTVYLKNIAGGTTSGNVFIYDLTGRKLFQDKLQNIPINTYTLDVNEGYYLVKVITPDNTYHQKVYLK